MIGTSLKEMIAGCLRARHLVRHFRRLLTQAVKGFYIRRFGWQ